MAGTFMQTVELLLENWLLWCQPDSNNHAVLSNSLMLLLAIFFCKALETTL